MSTLCCDPVHSGEGDVLAVHLERLVSGRTGTRIRDLQVQVDEGEVTLRGVASSYYAKQLATHIALSEVGPRALNNAIDVV